jgi:predicted ATPase
MAVDPHLTALSPNRSDAVAALYDRFQLLVAGSRTVRQTLRATVDLSDDLLTARRAASCSAGFHRTSRRGD